jgi:hypothetical protein
MADCLARCDDGSNTHSVKLAFMLPVACFSDLPARGRNEMVGCHALSVSRRTNGGIFALGFMHSSGRR